MSLRSKLKISILAFLCIWFPLSASDSVTFTVDPNNQNPDFFQTTSLEQAINNIVSNYYLFSYDIQITLSSSCVGTFQYIGNSLVWGFRGLSIQYNSPNPPVSQTSDCSLLPTVVVGPNSQILIEYLASLTFLGVNIQYNADPSYNSLIYSVNEVIFSNVCFNNSEASHSLPIGYTGTQFYIYQLPLCSITDMIFLNDGNKEFTLLNVAQIIVNGLTVVQLPWATQIAASSIFFENNESLDSIITLSTVNIICDPASSLGPNLFWFENFDTTDISGITLSGCNFQQSPQSQMFFFSIWSGNSLSIDAMNVSDLQFGTQITGDLFDLRIITRIQLSNFDISNISSHPNFLSIYDEIYSTVTMSTGMSLVFTNWQISNSQFSGSNIIYMSINNYFNFAGASISNLTIFNTSLTNLASAITFSVNESPLNTLTENLLAIPIQNISLIGCTLANESAFSVFFLNVKIGTTSVETIHVDVSNSVFINNSLLAQSYGVITEGLATSIMNLYADNNIVEDSIFYAYENTIGSLFVSNSKVTNLSLSENAAFFGVVINTIRPILEFEPSSANQDYGLFAPTRPAIFYNCSFQDIQIYSGSSFIYLANPMMIYQQNYATGLVMDSSVFINVGNYPNFVTNIEFYNTSAVPLNSTLIYPFPAAENYLFQDNSALYSIYESAKNNIYSDNQENTIFFISIQDNIFDSLNASSQVNIIAVSNFQVPNSSIVVSSNTFTNISSNGSVSLISAGYLTLCFFVNQVVSAVNSQGYLVSYITSTIEYLLLQNNTMTNMQKLGFYDLEADDCNQIIIQDDNVTALQTQETFVNIVCELMDGQIILQNSRFDGIIQSGSPESIEKLSFISFTAQESSGVSVLYGFENNSFSNITLTQQGYSKQRYQNSFLFVSSLASSIAFTNTSFDLITMSSVGSVFELDLPSVTMSNSNFTRFNHSSMNGAINTVLTSLTISGCIFGEILGMDAIGVFKLTNPEPSTILLSGSMQQSVFSNNVASSTALLALKNSSVDFSLFEMQIINNQALTDGGALFYLQSLWSSNISTINCNFTLTDIDPSSTKPQISTFELVQSQGDVKLIIQNSTLEVTGQTNGEFILTQGGQYNDVILISSLTYSATSWVNNNANSNSGDGGSTAPSWLVPQFSLFQGENVRATFQSVQVSQMQINQNGLMTINCDPSNQGPYECVIEVFDSNFQDLRLSQPVITINSQASSSWNALNGLAVLIQNSTFNNITWLSSNGSNILASGSEISPGIISSTTSLVGRSFGQKDFAINITNCLISALTGANGLVYNGIETMFDLVLVLQNNSIDSISATGPGGVIQVLMNGLTLVESNASSRNTTFLLSLNNFSNISTLSSEGGAILYWTSQSRGISIVSENNTLSGINSIQGSGGVFSMKYTPNSPTILNLTNSSLSPEYFVMLNSTFDFYNQITAQQGAIIYARGMNTLMNFNFQNNKFQTMRSESTGGMMTIDPGIYAVSTTFSYSTIRRVLCYEPRASITGTERVLAANPAQMGSIILIKNSFTDISAQNGGVLFENTTIGTLAIIATNNSFTEVTAGSRGGVFFLNQEIVSIDDNILNMTCANLTGSFIYSVVGVLNISIINKSNTVLDPSSKCDLYAFGPTNLSIQFIPLIGNPNSVFQYEQSSPTSCPVIANLTSYSFTEYQVNFTLVYQDNYGYSSNQYEVVVDESQSRILKLTFTYLDSSSAQNYVSQNCSGSTCTASPTSVILEGYAGDLISVNATYQSDVYTQSQLFYIQLRACIPGELNNTENGQCIDCKSGSYSLVTNDSKCQNCPTGATCNGGASITIKPGYYRSMSTNSSLIIIPCNDSGTRCLGGDYQTNCSDAYSGIACSQCNSQNGYFSSGEAGTCSQCYEKTKLISFTVLLLIASILCQVIMSVVTYDENKNLHTQYLSEKMLKNTASQKHAPKLDDDPSMSIIISSRTQNPNKKEQQQEELNEEKELKKEEELKQEEDLNEEEEQQQQKEKEEAMMRKNKKQADFKPGAFIVIFSTFVQISSVLSNFDIGTASTLISSSVSAGNSNTQAFFSLQCLYMLVTPDLFKGLQFKTLVYVFSPLVKIAAVAVFEALRSLISYMIMLKNRHRKTNQRNEGEEGGETRRISDVFTNRSNQITTTTAAIPTANLSTSFSSRSSLLRIGAVAAVIFLLEQPGIIANLFQYLTCIQLDLYVSRYYIQSQNNIECYTDQYNSFLRTVIIPALIFWALLVPLVIILVLYYKRRKLFASEALRVVLGNFYNPYSKETYYWGIVIIIFKMSIFILDSVLTSSLIAKGIVFMMIIHSYFMLFRIKPPYNHDYLNRAEKYCSLAYMTVLTIAFVKISTENVFVNNLCDVLILACIIGAGGYIVVNVFWPCIVKALRAIKKCKETDQKKREFEENLEILKTYHKNFPRSQYYKHSINGKDKIDLQLTRRNAISVEIPISNKNRNISGREGKPAIVKPLKDKKGSNTHKKTISQRIQAIFSQRRVRSTNINLELNKKKIDYSTEPSTIKNLKENIDLEEMGTRMSTMRGPFA